jgi:hypothetical protein
MTINNATWMNVHSYSEQVRLWLVHKDYLHVPKLPHSIPKGEYISRELSAIVIVKRESER